jgi:acyl dehydratase
MTDFIENRTYDEIQIGESASLTRSVSEADVQLFAALSGDVNPAHLDHEYANASMFGGVIAHGIFSGALVSTCRARAPFTWGKLCASRARSSPAIS